jgi:hypothetical protein
MKPQYNSPGIKFPASPRYTQIKNITSLFGVNMNVRESKRDIVLNIRLDANQLSDLFRSIAEKSFSEDFNQVDQK